jgi:hypothetical protein
VMVRPQQQRALSPAPSAEHRYYDPPPVWGNSSRAARYDRGDSILAHPNRAIGSVSLKTRTTTITRMGTSARMAGGNLADAQGSAEGAGQLR